MDTLFETLSVFVRNIASYVTFDYLMLGSLSLLLLVLIYFLIKTNFTFEVRMLRTVIKLNKYFIAEPYVTDENLVRFNKRMKNVPRSLRYHWQEFMLNRDKAPSDYMNPTVCVDQPSKASGYGNTANSINTYTIIIALLTLMIGVSHLFSSSITDKQFYFQILILPVIILVVGFLFVAFIRARHTSIVADLYYQFHEFERNINKACTTLPQFIDYELLFTKKEIKEGIPVLQEYLEKRAVQEKLEQDEAALTSLHYEEYDFSELGIETSLLLDRSMLESEKYFVVRDDLKSKIRSIELEKQNYKRNFDDVTKDFEKRAQTIREAMAEYNEQLNNIVNKIEANYTKKLRDEEVKKMQQAEKEYENARERFVKQDNELQQEIDALNAEVDRRKKILEEAMLSEGKTYANKLFAMISKDVKEETQPYIDQLEQTKEELENSVAGLKVEIETKNLEVESKNKQLEQIEHEYKTKLAGIEGIQALKEYIKSADFREQVIKTKKEKIKGAEELVAKLNEYENKTAALEKELKDALTEVDGLKTVKTGLESELMEVNKKVLMLQNETDRLTAVSNKKKSDVKKSDNMGNDADDDEGATPSEAVKEEKPKPAKEKEVAKEDETKKVKTDKKEPKKKKQSLKRVSQPASKTTVTKKTNPVTPKQAEEISEELDELENLKNKIEKENSNLEKQQKELQEAIEKTITTLESDVENITKEAKATPARRKPNLGESLNQLVDAASKIKNKNNKDDK